MIGETITARYGNRHAWVVWMIVGLFLIVGDLAMEHRHLLILSAAPIGIGFALIVARREPLVIHIHDEGIEVCSPNREFIPFDSIEAITAGDHVGRQYSIAILHGGGALNLPPQIDVDSRDLFRFLRRELPEDETIGPPPALREFMQTQDAAFGEDRVFVYRSLAEPRLQKGRTGLLVSISLLMTSVLWIIIGAVFNAYDHWAGAGILAAFGSIIACVVFASTRGAGNRAAGDGGIIIAPGGIAVEQGLLRGMMRWEEIADIESSRMRRLIKIHFAGGVLNLGDTYHRALRVIRQRLLDFWEGPIDDRY